MMEWVFLNSGLFEFQTQNSLICHFFIVTWDHSLMKLPIWWLSKHLKCAFFHDKKITQNIQIDIFLLIQVFLCEVLKAMNKSLFLNRNFLVSHSWQFTPAVLYQVRFFAQKMWSVFQIKQAPSATKYGSLGFVARREFCAFYIVGKWGKQLLRYESELCVLCPYFSPVLHVQTQ